MSFANLKKRSKSKDKISSLVAASAEQNTSKSFGDDRKWKVTRDEAGNGFAVIRFLPNKNEDNLPWVRYWDHFFKGPLGQWYVEKSLTTIGKDDPVGEANSKLWNLPNDSGKEQARVQKRRLHYVSNILVIEDSGNPANNGKVMLYEYGKTIKDQIEDAMQPEFADEDPINPFDLWDGANFKLKVRKVDGWPKYDKSSFADPTPIFDDDDMIEDVYNKMYDIDEFVDPSSFKSFEDLQARLNKVLGKAEPTQGNVDHEEESEPEISSESYSEPIESYSEPTDDDGDDDSLNYFKELAG
jgi:hypothetical protein